MVNLHSLKPKRGSKKRKIVVGRGNASGHGTYSGRGIKGQKSRTGGRKGLKQLGMRNLLAQTPKLGGFKSMQKQMSPISLADLNKLFVEGDVVSPHALRVKKNISNKNLGIKILGKGELKKKLEVRAHDFSISARKAITEAGGKAIIIPILKKR